LISIFKSESLSCVFPLYIFESIFEPDFMLDYNDEVFLSYFPLASSFV